MVNQKDSWAPIIGLGIMAFSWIILLFTYFYNRKLYKESVKEPYELILRKVDSPGNYNDKNRNSAY